MLCVVCCVSCVDAIRTELNCKCYLHTKHRPIPIHPKSERRENRALGPELSLPALPAVAGDVRSTVGCSGSCKSGHSALDPFPVVLWRGVKRSGRCDNAQSDAAQEHDGLNPVRILRVSCFVTRCVVCTISLYRLNPKNRATDFWSAPLHPIHRSHSGLESCSYHAAPTHGTSGQPGISTPHTPTSSW